MTRVVAVANQKGGVGKTVTSINLAANLARSGRRTLLVDLDPQGHSGVGLGIDGDKLPLTIADALLERTVPVADVVVPVGIEGLENLFLVPSNLQLALAEQELERRYQIPVRVLSVKLAALGDRFDEIVIDCPPSLSKLTISAFLASQEILVPVGANYFGLQGVERMAETLRDISEELGVTFRVFGLVTRYREGQKVSREVHGAVKGLFGDHAFSTLVRENAAVEQSTGAGLPLCTFAPGSQGAKDYDALVDELLERRRLAEPVEAAVAAIGRVHGEA